MTPLLTYKQRLLDLTGRCEGLAEDMASAVDEGDVDVDVYDAVNEAFEALERANKLI